MLLIHIAPDYQRHPASLDHQPWDVEQLEDNLYHELPADPNPQYFPKSTATHGRSISVQVVSVQRKQVMLYDLEVCSVLFENGGGWVSELFWLNCWYLVGLWFPWGHDTSIKHNMLLTGDTFRWKGENCSTMEVSEVVSKVPGIEEANVYGVKVSSE